jgi:hypothetical protein
MAANQRTVIETLNLYKGSTREPLSWIVAVNGQGYDLDGITVDVLMLTNEGTEAEPEFNATPKIAQTDSNVTVQPTKAFTVDSTDDWIIAEDHGVPNNWKVVFSGGSLPSGITAGTTYYSRDVYNGRFKIAAYEGGDAVDIGSGSGSFYIAGHVQYQWQSADVNTAGLYSVWFVLDDGTRTEREPADKFGIVVSINETVTAA